MPRITPVHWKTLEQVMLAAGFQFVRQSGSHRVYVKKGISRPVVIPVSRSIPIGVIRNNLKTAGLTRDEYFRLLQTT